jgi:hypothetical protein
MIGRDGMFDVGDTQNADLSFFSLYQEGPPPPIKSRIKPTSTTSSGNSRQPLLVKTADIAKISSHDDMLRKTSPQTKKNYFRGNPKPPNTMKPSELKSNPLKNNRLFK